VIERFGSGLVVLMWFVSWSTNTINKLFASWSLNPMSSPVQPSLLVSTKLPSLEELTTQLNAFMARLATYEGKNSWFANVQRQSLQQQITKKQQQIEQLQHPTDQSGVPPAPDAGAIFGPRIEVPKVGFDDLKITLPR